MKILALNPGSSSLKRRTYDLPSETAVADSETVDAVGIRVVHGGSTFVGPTRVDDSVIASMRSLDELAPLHNPVAVELIEKTRGAMPGIPIVAAFDTAFHQTIPPVASTYAIPPHLGIRRYGFHGLSYAYVSSRISARRQIACHLGNGASVCAIRDGKSVDTSMGFTPLEGLVMGTRAGDLDPGAILYLLRKGEGEPDLDDLLNHKCGLLGISGRSADVRELEESARGGDARSDFALELFAYRVQKYIGAYTVVLGGVDALVFTGGIGEHSASMRLRICEQLDVLGIVLDEDLNSAPRTDERLISRGRVEVWVIPANEELEIARSTYRALTARS